MDEDNQGGALNTVVDGTEDALGGFDVASIRAKQAKYNTLAEEKKAFYDQMEKDLLARRMGPTLSEKLFQIASALSQPTETRGFGASLANVMPVLQQQAQQRREGEISRADALQKLRMAQLAGKQELLGKELDTEVALARINASANKLGNVVSGPNGPLEGRTGLPVAQPTQQAYADLEANPTEENLKAMVDYYPRFRKEFVQAYQRGLFKKGVVK
jgi:hypothetical protein